MHQKNRTLFCSYSNSIFVIQFKSSRKRNIFFSRRKAIIWQEIHHLWNHVSNLFTIEHAHKPVITLSTTKLPKSQWRAHSMDDTNNWDEKSDNTFAVCREYSKWKKNLPCHLGWLNHRIYQKKCNGRVTAEHLADFINWFANGCKKKSQNSWSCLSLLNQQVHLMGDFLKKNAFAHTHKRDRTCVWKISLSVYFYRINLHTFSDVNEKNAVNWKWNCFCQRQNEWKMKCQ